MRKRTDFYYAQVMDDLLKGYTAFINKDNRNIREEYMSGNEDSISGIMDKLTAASESHLKSFLKVSKENNVRTPVAYPKENIFEEDLQKIMVSYIELHNICKTIRESTKFRIGDIDSALSSDLTFDSGCTLNDKDCCIVFEYNGIKYCIVSYTRTNAVIIKNRKYVHQVYVFSTAIRSHTEHTGFPIYKILLTEDYSKFVVEIEGSDKYVRDNIWGITTKFNTIDVKDTNTTIARATTVNSDCKRLGIMNPDDILKVTAYVVYAYNNRHSYIRKRKKKEIVRNVHKIHESHEGKYEVCEIPIESFVREYEPRIYAEYKGGHHASPVTHERNGFFRKSRGRGDYDYANGEFVYVGNKLGHYSYVSPTTVNGKSNADVIYKVN